MTGLTSETLPAGEGTGDGGAGVVKTLESQLRTSL